MRGHNKEVCRLLFEAARPNRTSRVLSDKQEQHQQQQWQHLQREKSVQGQQRSVNSIRAISIRRRLKFKKKEADQLLRSSDGFLVAARQMLAKQVRVSPVHLGSFDAGAAHKRQKAEQKAESTEHARPVRHFLVLILLLAIFVVVVVIGGHRQLGYGQLLGRLHSIGRRQR